MKETPALTGYCKTFPSKSMQCHQLLKKDKITPNTEPEIPQVYENETQVYEKE